MNIQTQQLNLLIVEDDPSLAASLKVIASDYFKVIIAQKASLIPEHVFFHAALVDMHLEVVPPEAADGIAIIQKLVKKNPQLEVVAMSGNLDRQLMEKAIHAGAQRFLAKPLSVEELTSVLEKIEAYWNLRFASLDQQKFKSQLVGSSQYSENLRKQIASLKSEKAPVLIEGETGVGKDVVAQILNRQEPKRPFITVNCSALNENLFESEFFGHVKGSFTGAESNKIGFAEAANGGDLFLDEIEALPLTQQAKLLRFLESGEIRKVGSKDVQYVQVRVIAASNIPLKQLIAQKKFREDLYFRLSAHRIEIAALRSRTEDISDIANYFVEAEKPKRNKSFDVAAILCLKKYTWPGNIRELKRVCEQLLLTSPLPVIRESDVQKLIFNEIKSDNSQLSLDQSLEDFLKKQEKKIIDFCLSQTKDIDKSCEILKISKSSLYKKIKDLGIQYE
ncbi:MAG: sigma-54 dependent transcriptional regulator [Pseudobdellovibrio sp.]